MKIRRAPDGWRRIAAFLGIMFVGGHVAVAAPPPLPPNSSPYGMTYGEWSAKHWQWLFSIPAEKNPVNDNGSCTNGGQGQFGPVWFLVGVWSTTPVPSGFNPAIVKRECTIPVGKAIFFPIGDAECATLEGNPPPGTDLRTCAKLFADAFTTVSATIDNVPIQNLSGYRVQSPLFTYGPLPSNSLLCPFGPGDPASCPYGDVTGKTSDSVADGYYLMFPPLSVGKHTIKFSASAPSVGFSLDVTYTLHVQSPR